jgi:hypothetical protein
MPSSGNHEGVDMRHGTPRGTNRLLHDLAAVGRMQRERPTAYERIEALLGSELTGVLHTTLVTAAPTGGLQPRRAA